MNSDITKAKKMIPLTRDRQLISANLIQQTMQTLLGLHRTEDLTYRHITTQFEAYAQQFNWLNMDGSIYSMSLNILKKYITLQQSQIELQSITSYLTALKEKHIGLSWSSWKSIRSHEEVLLMLKNIKRRHQHK